MTSTASQPKMPEISGQARPGLSHGLRLQWEPAQKSYVLLYPEGMVRLNRSAGEIMSRCDGKRTVDEIITDLETAFATTRLGDDIRAFMAMATQKGWLELRA
jgi:pyrroloquinoline quinone biosynthesis protein D